MTNNGAESTGLHPTIGELLLYVDHEIEPDRAGAVEAHLAICKECTRARDGIAQGITVLTAVKDSAQLPPPPHSMAFLDARLGDDQPSLLTRALPTRWLAPFSGRRIAWAGAFASVLILVGVLFQTAQQVASASQLLTRSIAAADSAQKAGKTIRQTVRVRQGNRVIEKSVFRGTQARHSNTQEPDAGLSGILAQASVDWNDPLNPRDFARWHEAQVGRSDVISESAGTFTITTSTKDSTITAGSLTLAQSDWRPIARRIDLRAESPVEISEIGYELIDAPSVMGTVRPSANAVAEVSPPPAETGSVSPLPSPLRLEESELRLREILALLGLDMTAAPAIWRTADSVHFRIYPGSPEDSEKLRAAVKEIPLVVEGGENPAQASDNVTAPLAREFESPAPFARTLESRLGGLEQMNEYLTGIQDRYGRALARSTTVSALATRYPATYQMPDSLEQRLNRLAGDHVTAQKSELVSYLQSLDLGLDAIRSRNAAGARQSAKGGVCATWQESARPLAQELRELNIAFLRLFISEKTATPVEQSPETLLANAERLKVSLEQHLAVLCAPIGR